MRHLLLPILLLSCSSCAGLTASIETLSLRVEERLDTIERAQDEYVRGAVDEQGLQDALARERTGLERDFRETVEDVEAQFEDAVAQGVGLAGAIAQNPAEGLLAIASLVAGAWGTKKAAERAVNRQRDEARRDRGEPLARERPVTDPRGPLRGTPTG